MLSDFVFPGRKFQILGLNVVRDLSAYIAVLRLLTATSILRISFCKRLIVFNCKVAFLQVTKICPSKFNLLSIVTPSNLTVFCCIDCNVLNI